MCLISVGLTFAPISCYFFTLCLRTSYILAILFILRVRFANTMGETKTLFFFSSFFPMSPISLFRVMYCFLSVSVEDKSNNKKKTRRHHQAAKQSI
jgi:hypothetical protein